MSDQSMPSYIFFLLNNLDAEVQLFRDKGSWRDDAERWGCAITVSADGTELKVRSVGPTGDVALTTAYEKLRPLIATTSVAKALCLPALPPPVNASPYDLETIPTGSA